MILFCHISLFSILSDSHSAQCHRYALGVAFSGWRGKEEEKIMTIKTPRKFFPFFFLRIENVMKFVFVLLSDCQRLHENIKFRRSPSFLLLYCYTA